NLETITFLDQAAVQVARATHVDHAKILQYRPDRSDLFMIAGMGWREDIIRSATFPTDLASAPGRCFKTAEPIIIDDVNAQSEFRISPILIEHDIVSLANVPMLVDGAAWGVLEVDSSERRDFGADTSEFMTAAAAIIGAGLRRRNAEQAAAEASVAAAAGGHQHDVFLREMQHRVKNNFQLILASITMQKRRTTEKQVRAALDGIADRINAISVAHEQLAPGQDGKTVNAAGYLTALCSSISQQTERVAIEVTAEEFMISIDRIVPLGLILNEVATNSIKHAFDDDAGRIEVNLSAAAEGELRLTIADNGKGFQNPRAEGSGLKLISSLARQIGGRVDQTSSEKGTATSVVFPVIG
ncbi:MAG: hypothetical protein JWR73_1932, partial [Tardiphaga sp.]|nr:hypothetical protein [Tardiphaga sp.]